MFVKILLQLLIRLLNRNREVDPSDLILDRFNEIYFAIEVLKKIWLEWKSRFILITEDNTIKRRENSIILNFSDEIWINLSGGIVGLFQIKAGSL